MAGDKKEESGFGFKDKAKAEETLRLLQDHELQYQRLTVRGLLGRAKRVLSLTKAQDKITNIKEAMAVFEEWLEKEKEERGADKESKSKDKDGKSADKKPADKKSDKKREDEKMEEGSSDDNANKSNEKEVSSKPDTVAGLGFKDAEAAKSSLKVLEGRDPDYQKLAVKGLVGRAKRVLTGTRDETKVQNIKDAVEILEEYLSSWEREGRGALNCAYLPLEVVESGLALAAEKELAPGDGDLVHKFISAYRSVNGEYKRLRTAPAPDGRTWDIVRNACLGQLKEQNKDAALTQDGDPTPEHLKMVLWAYSPQPSSLKPLGSSGRESRKRSSAQEADASPAKKTKA